MRILVAFTVATVLASNLTVNSQAAEPWLVFPGGDGPAKGKHVVLISGDEEYRSEEGLPQLAKILAKHHGFTCTVLFAINPKDGIVSPNYNRHIPGLSALKTADLMIIATRFRDLPDDEMRYIVDYVDSGRPIIGMRTATHAFALSRGKYKRYSYNSRDWPGGFGRQVLGETWVDHHGLHGQQSTRGIIAPGQANNPILRGIHDDDIWGPTDVYKVNLPLPASCVALVLGEVLDGMKPTDKPATGKKNHPMMPVAWTNAYHSPSGKTARIFTTTMGASQDLLCEGLRRLLVNACYWAVGMEDQIRPHANVALVGKYEPSRFGFQKDNYWRKRPADYAR